MKNYVVIYHAPAEAMEMMANATPEQKAEGMKPWMAWKEKLGDQLIDLGTPLVGGLKLKPDGSTETSQKEVTGYSIIRAKDMDGAKAILADHPHLQWTGGCGIEVHESVPL